MAAQVPTLRIDGFNEEYFTQIRTALQNRLKVIDERSVRNSGREPIGRLPTDEKRAAYLAKAIDDMIENKKYISPQCAMLLDHQGGLSPVHAEGAVDLYQSGHQSQG